MRIVNYEISRTSVSSDNRDCNNRDILEMIQSDGYDKLSKG